MQSFKTLTEGIASRLRFYSLITYKKVRSGKAVLIHLTGYLLQLAADHMLQHIHLSYSTKPQYHQQINVEIRRYRSALHPV